MRQKWLGCAGWWLLTSSQGCHWWPGQHHGHHGDTGTWGLPQGQPAQLLWPLHHPQRSSWWNFHQSKWMRIKVKNKMILLSYHFWDINVFQLGRIVWSCSIHCHICVEDIIPLFAVPFKANKHTHWTFGCNQATSQSEKCIIECLPWLSKQTGV